MKNSLKEKTINYVKWKDNNNSFYSWIDKNDIVQISEFFPESKSSGRTVKVELDLSNYATKADLKNATGIDTYKLLNRLI